MANKKVKKKIEQKAVSKNKEITCHDHTGADHYPSYTNQKRRLSRVKGQLEGIDKMIDDNRYCMDIIYQIRAATQALKSLEKEIMQTHIKSCVIQAFESNDHASSQKKIQEILDLF
jgi:DNA-binding FrmR family transcriptional regulator